MRGGGIKALMSQLDLTSFEGGNKHRRKRNRANYGTKRVFQIPGCRQTAKEERIKHHLEYHTEDTVAQAALKNL